MRISKRSLILAVCMVLAVSLSVFSTIAYLTSSDTVTNTFTVGKVKIDVDEAVVNPNGEPTKDGQVVADLKDADRTEDDDEGVEGNQYHLLPAVTYAKDPTVTVLAGSEDSYIRMLVTLTHIDAIESVAPGFKPGDHVTGYDSAKWIYAGYEDGTEPGPVDPETQLPEDVKIRTYEFRYFETVNTMGEGAADKALEPLFTAFTVPATLDGDDLDTIKDVEIRVVGQAIQSAGFAAEGEKSVEDVAWEALEDQLKNEQNP